MSYTYKKQVTITGQSGAGNNYQIPLLVGESSGSGTNNFHLNGHSGNFPSGKDQGGDLKFLANNETTALDFWVESVTGTTPNRVATVWVEVQADLGSNQNIYVYYGDAAASNLSSGSNTFPFFDDFLGSAIDTSKWTVASGSMSVSSSEVTTGNTADPSDGMNTSGKVTITSESNRGLAMRFNINRTGTTDTVARLFSSASDQISLGNTSYNNLGVYTNYGGVYGSAQTGHGGNTTGDYIYELKADNTTLYYTASMGVSGSVGVSASVYSKTWYMFVGGGDVNYPMNPINFFLVRRFVAVEPAFSSAGSETPTAVIRRSPSGGAAYSSPMMY